jgi:hypothetical protein
MQLLMDDAASPSARHAGEWHHDPLTTPVIFWHDCNSNARVLLSHSCVLADDILVLVAHRIATDRSPLQPSLPADLCNRLLCVVFVLRAASIFLKNMCHRSWRKRFEDQYVLPDADKEVSSAPTPSLPPATQPHSHAAAPLSAF